MIDPVTQASATAQPENELVPQAIAENSNTFESTDQKE
jgi:hypothetical protein